MDKYLTNFIGQLQCHPYFDIATAHNISEYSTNMKRTVFTISVRWAASVYKLQFICDITVYHLETLFTGGLETCG